MYNLIINFINIKIYNVFKVTFLLMFHNIIKIKIWNDHDKLFNVSKISFITVNSKNYVYID